MTKKILFTLSFILLSFSLVSAAQISIPLQPGWNLINSPLNLTDSSITTIIAPIEKKILSVWKWDNYIWSVYLPGIDKEVMESYAASKGFSILWSINAGEGFWIHAKESMLLDLSGTYK